MEGEGEGDKTLSAFSTPAFYLSLVNLILLTDSHVQIIELRTFSTIVCLYPVSFCFIQIFKANAKVKIVEYAC